MTEEKKSKKTYFEFFAGGGMARLGLSDAWQCLFANDFDSQKAAAYCQNFGSEHFTQNDVAELTVTDLPEVHPDLVWSSFPCQDLSHAGARRGLAGRRSGVFYAFWSLMKNLAAQGRAPKLLVLENVTGLISSNGRRDIQSIITVLADAGYLVSALVLDAAAFMPHSRKRVFIFGFQAAPEISLTMPEPDAHTPAALIETVNNLPTRTAQSWRWLKARPQHKRNIALTEVIDQETGPWHTRAQTTQLMDAMTMRQRAAIASRLNDKKNYIGTAYKRIRLEDGAKVLRVEARFDGLAGCLRTPAGGSSRQLIFVINNGQMRSRLLSPREAARLMGLPEEYQLPKSATAALKLCGDGVAVPVVRWIAETILTPALADISAAA